MVTGSELALLRVLANPQVGDDEPVPPLEREPVRAVAGQALEELVATDDQRRRITHQAFIEMLASASYRSCGGKP